MRPTTPPPVALLAILLVAVIAVLFADILAVSAVAGPLRSPYGRPSRLAEARRLHSQPRSRLDRRGHKPRLTPPAHAHAV